MDVSKFPAPAAVTKFTLRGTPLSTEAMTFDAKTSSAASTHARPLSALLYDESAPAAGAGPAAGSPRSANNQRIQRWQQALQMPQTTLAQVLCGWLAFRNMLIFASHLRR